MNKHKKIMDAIADYHGECIRTDDDNDILNDIINQAGSKRIYTSNYSRSSSHENAVSISASSPEYFQGNHIKSLAPSWEILNAFKEGKINELEYTKRYLNLLTERGLTPQNIYDAIPNGTILLCYEKANDFCHRRILAEWLKKKLGVDIPEWETEKERRKSATVDSLLDF